jgi:uncharacterized protein
MSDSHSSTLAVRSAAEIATPRAKRYLTQLCKHFEHRLPVSHDERSGRIAFTTGECRLDAEEGLLTLSLAAADAEQLAQLQDVVARHLLRFAFREEMRIEWRAA